MRKFKIISTCAAVLLMLALMSFGVYAVSTVSVTVSGTISFKCTDVYIKVGYGIVGNAEKTCGPYYSQPGTPITWKSSQEANAQVVSLADLPALEFSETSTTCQYYITVKNLHGMPIYFSFGYKWYNEKTNNVIQDSAKYYSVDSGFAESNEIKPTISEGITAEHQVNPNAIETLVVTLTLSNTNYEADGKICLVMAASVESGGAKITADDLVIS